MSRPHVIAAVTGLGLGYALSRMGFADYTELRSMFTLRDPRLFAAFASAVLITAIGVQVLKRDRRPARKPLHSGSVLGGILFGTGWALTGACPSIPLVQLGQGYVPAIAIVVGIIAGARLWRFCNARWLRWSTGSC